MNEPRCILRQASPNDAEGVTAVLANAYPALMAPDYDTATLEAVLPAMVVANARLLASGTYHVQEAPGGTIVSCGGWTVEAPGTNAIENGVAHIRHFGTHANWIRKGLGAAIFERCRNQALPRGIQIFRCFSSLNAEAFYAALGFRVVERTEIQIGGQLKFPTVVMVWTDAAA